MPFIGTTPAQGFASSVNKQSFTANGSTTSFTLTHPVSNANDLEVFVGNVRQEPTAAYTASGTTLDFGSGNAPPSGVNLYVVYKNLAQVTTTPPDGSVGTGKIAANAVTVGKLATSGTLPALDGSALINTGSLVKVASSSSSSGVASVTFDNVITATYDDYLLVGSVVGTDGANFSVDIYYRDGSSNISSGGNTGISHYQGQMVNRAASTSYLGAVLNGANAYLRLPVTGDVYGGGIFTFKIHFHNLFSGMVTGVTNLTSPNTRNIRNGNYQWSAQTTNASDYHGGSGWFRADNPDKNLTSIDGLLINSGNNNFVRHNMALYGYVK